VLGIPPIDPGDHHIDSITSITLNRLQIDHVNPLERVRALSHELILGEGNSMINLSPRRRALEGSSVVPASGLAL
jgi:hypothetical protein